MSLQILDKSKAITQILQEVRSDPCWEKTAWYSISITNDMASFSDCCVQEEMQKAAFQALQLQKDALHNYIRDQVFVWGCSEKGLWVSPLISNILSPKRAENGHCLIS